MDEVAAEAPMYSAAVFKVNNEEWFPWPRRRILIILFDNEQADGPNSVLRARQLVKDTLYANAQAYNNKQDYNTYCPL